MSVDRFKHSCARSDEDERIITNLLRFGRFAIPEQLPPYPPHRAHVLVRLQRQYSWRTTALEQAAGVAAVDRSPELTAPANLWPPDQIRDRVPAPRVPRPEESRFRGRA